MENDAVWFTHHDRRNRLAINEQFDKILACCPNIAEAEVEFILPVITGLVYGFV
jgi:hypothetical protein